MKEYTVKAAKKSRYNRSLLINGTTISVNVDGRDGTVQVDRDLTEDEKSMLGRFYNISFEGETTLPDPTPPAPQPEPNTPAPAPTPAPQDTNPPADNTQQPQEPQTPTVTVTDEDGKDIQLTADELTSAHEQEGSWSAVAAKYNLSSYMLRKARDELGI